MAVVYSNFFGSAFFDDGFFGPGVEEYVGNSGGKGDNSETTTKHKRGQRSIFKPLGIVDRPKKNESIESTIIGKRLQQSQEVAAEIAAAQTEQAAREAKALFVAGQEASARQAISVAFDNADRAAILRAKEQREEDESIIALLTALAALDDD